MKTKTKRRTTKKSVTLVHAPKLVRARKSKPKAKKRTVARKSYSPNPIHAKLKYAIYQLRGMDRTFVCAFMSKIFAEQIAITLNKHVAKGASFVVGPL